MSCIKSLSANWPLGLCLALILTAVGIGQTITGTISGTVVDPNGGIVPAASVTLTSTQTGATRNVVTNEEGRFTFPALQPGIYTITIEHSGFQKLLREKVVLSANENLALGELALAVGSASETVTVTSSGATVEIESSDLTARLTSDQIDLISTKGRDITSLLRLIPGTSNDDDIEAVGEGFGTNLPNISGQRGRSNVPTIDGLNAGEPSGSNKLSMSINQDAVAEVKILRNNYAAEYGNNGGAIINLVSKSGGKNYKGTAYYFLRNEALNASPFFTNKAGLEKPLYRHNIWGFNFGGPMWIPRFGESEKFFWKDKGFFFFSYEKPHTITPTSPVFVTVPTALERMGDFSQSLGLTNGLILDPITGLQFKDPSRATPSNPQGLNIIPLNRFNSSGAILLNVFPLPNAPFSQREGVTGNSGLYNYVIQKSVDVPKRSMVIRFDFKATRNDSFYWKKQWFTSDNEGFGTSGWPSGDANRWGINSHYLYKDNGWSMNWVHILSPKMVNEFTFGMRHDSEGFIPSDGEPERFSRATTGYSAQQLFPINNRLGTIPRATTWTGIVGTPANINWLDRWGEIGNDYIEPSFADNVSDNIRNHSLKFGFYYERLKNGEAPGGNWTGTFNFAANSTTNFPVASGNTTNAYANALLGNFNSYTEANARPFTNLALTLFQWYAQDQWKVNNRLTLNYGIRWGYHSPFYQVDKQGSNFDSSRFNPAAAPLIYYPWCAGLPASQRGIPALGTSCSTSNQRAIDPRVLASLPPNTNPTSAQLLSRFLIRTFVPGTGTLTNGLALGTDPSTPKGFRTTPSVDWEPRVGFAYDLTGKQKTVVRSMFGIYHSPRVGGGTTGGNLVNNPPGQLNYTINNANINDIATFFQNGQAVNFPSTINAIEITSHTPTIYNFSLGVQQDIGFGTVLEASYVGSLSRHLGERRNINSVPDGARFVNCPLAAAMGVTCHPENRDPNSTFGALNNDFLRPFPGLGDINQVTWSGTSNYNALQVQVNRRYSRGFQYGVAYTWSKTMDYANDDSADVNNGRPYKAFNYGPADFDQTHILTVNYIWDIPLFRKAGNSLVRAILGGWQLSGTTSFATGKPKDFSVTYSGTVINISPGQTCPEGSFIGNIITGTGSTAGLYPCNPITDFTGGQVNALPYVICDPNQGATGADSTGTPYIINRDCFQRPTRLGQIGNQQRNLGRRPNIFNTDLAFFKNFKWGEKRGIQLRWETYNLFNRTNFSDFDGAMTFGMILAQSNPTVPCTRASAVTTNVCSAQYVQSNDRFGAPTAARSPRVMQASIRINF